jgi:hypothetical protein
MLGFRVCVEDVLAVEGAGVGGGGPVEGGVAVAGVGGAAGAGGVGISAAVYQAAGAGSVPDEVGDAEAVGG